MRGRPMPNIIVTVLTLLALLVLIGGLRFSHRSRRPRLMRTGAALAAAGLMLLWLLPMWLFSADRGAWAMPMFIGVMFVAVSVLGLGIRLAARACGEPEETAFDTAFEDFVRHNDLP